jgi:hypothetical protein
MAPEELLKALREKPFQPFQISLTDGRRLEVHHPEMVLAGKRSAVIGFPAPHETEPLYERSITVDLLHIVSLEPIQGPAKPNGQTGTSQS